MEVDQNSACISSICALRLVPYQYRVFRDVIEAMELSKINIGKTLVVNECICKICESNIHITKECPTILTFKKVLYEQTNFTNSYKQPFSGTYNPSWQNYPNFS